MISNNKERGKSKSFFLSQNFWSCSARPARPLATPLAKCGLSCYSEQHCTMRCPIDMKIDLNSLSKTNTVNLCYKHSSV